MVAADTQSLGAGSAVLIAVLGLAVAMIGPLVQLAIGRKQAAAAQRAADAAMISARNVGAHSIARFRQEWIENLRKLMAQYHSILMTREVLTEDDKLKLSDLGTQLDLLLNPEEPNSRKLLAVMDKILDTQLIQERWDLDGAFVASARIVLKGEWNRVKDELSGRW